MVPLVAAHRIADPAALAAGAVALLAFCACASSAYIVNDLLDLEADRAHPRKRVRPLASGELSIPAGILAAGVLLGAAALLALRLPAAFQWSLGVYFVTTVAYSASLKRWLAVDVIVLAGLYTLRIVAGGLAIGVAVSFWLLAFSLFLFFSLALLKRYVELSVHEDQGGRELPRRGYRVDDKPAVLGLGTAAGMVAALVLALYVNGDTAGTYYRTPEWLWLLGPLLMYWIARIWMLATRGDVHDDPVVFASTDRVSHVVAIAALVVLWLAT
jgi:4-hydroxybenzoate polyprenyltransferase